MHDENAGGRDCGKDAKRKSPKTDFPALLGNPAKPAGFPLSHSPDGCWLTRNRTFHVLQKPDILTCYGHGNVARAPRPRARRVQWDQGQTNGEVPCELCGVIFNAEFAEESAENAEDD